MRKFLSKLLFGLAIIGSSINAYSQSTVKGRLVDEATGDPLIGATVLVKGTSNGTITDLDGAFSVNADNGAVLVITYVGYVTQEVTVSGNDLGDISVKSDVIGLGAIEVLSSVATERKTPVAVSNVSAIDIEEKASNQEFPELLKATPGVYATKQGGGYGDSRINIRGFNSVNVAVLVNGIPVNDMENGRVYWSNWAGLTDVTRSMQVQRGLGASKVAVPSIGGTINISTRTTDAVKGGSVFFGTGNDGYKKQSFSVSSGLMDNGWAMTLSGAKITGNGWADGLEFEGYNYFFNLSKQVNDKHILSLTGFGAPQRHGQRADPRSIEAFRNAPRGTKYNPDWGVKDGEVVNIEDNFYHKPQFSLNHYWTIDDKSELSTALYMSFGTGGGGGTGGDFAPADRGYESQDLDALVEINRATVDGNALAFLRASRNDHEWYGLLSTYNREINSQVSVLAGLDLRSYVGHHFREITDLLGADYLLNDDDINNPNRVLGVGDKYSYNNDGHVNWIGGFLQGEYTKGALSTFVNVSLSNTGYKRVDFFNYADDDPLQETEFQNYFGYQIKGGANYNLNQNHNVFANVGYFSKAPDFDAVYPNNDQIVNTALTNQKILSYELGYGYRTKSLSANLNLYSTNWRDRTLADIFNIDDDPLTPTIDESEIDYAANLTGVNALHTGIEMDFVYQPNTALTVSGMFSTGNWEWQDDVDGVTVFDDDQNEVGSFDKLYIGGLKVGDAAQTTMALGVSYSFFPGFKMGMNYNYFDNLYADYDPTTRAGDDAQDAGQPVLFPSYSTVDMNMRYDFVVNTFDATLYGNINNLFNEEYISEGNGDSFSTANVYYGLGTTWTLGVKMRF